MSQARQAKPSASKPHKPKSKRRKTRGALAAIGALLLASAVVRVGIGAGEAIAREDTSEAGSNLNSVAQDASAQNDMSPSDSQVAFEGADGTRIITEADIEGLVRSLNKREARLKEKERAVAMHMQTIRFAEEKIDKKLAQLESAEQQLRDTIALAQTAAEDDLTQLTDVYASMKPKQAAALFEQMDAEFAAGFLGRMKADSAAEIMARMTPEAGYLVSVILAGRNAEVPTE